MTQYTFQDGVFSFWTAHYGSWNNDVRIVFRVREDSTVMERATQKGIKCYDRLLRSTQEEVAKWLEGHPNYEVE